MLVTIYSEKIQINVETIYSLFRGFGLIQKIIIFKKKNFQVFVELGSIEEAIAFKARLQAQSFDHVFNLKIQFTQKKELVVNNNTMMEYDFTKTDSQTRSEFRSNSFSNFSGEGFSDKRNQVFFQSCHEQPMLTPDALGRLLCVSPVDSRSRFLTPKGSNADAQARGHFPASARLNPKVNFSENSNPSPGDFGSQGGSLQAFEMMNMGRLAMPWNLAEPAGLAGQGKANWLDRAQEGRAEPQKGLGKEDALGKTSKGAKKKLSMKEKFKRKMLEKRRKKRLEKAERKSSEKPPLSTESKATLEKPCKEARDAQEKTAKKSVIINPNVVVKNFSFKGESKATDKKPFAQKPKEGRDASEATRKNSDFSLTNVEENLSQDSADQGKFNIFRMFDHEKPRDKARLLSPAQRKSTDKDAKRLLSLEQDCLSEEASKDTLECLAAPPSPEHSASGSQPFDLNARPGEFTLPRKLFGNPPDGEQAESRLGSRACGAEMDSLGETYGSFVNDIWGAELPKDKQAPARPSNAFQTFHGSLPVTVELVHVLLVLNVPRVLRNKQLFNLFSLYGNIERIALARETGVAVITFETQSDKMTALRFLHQLSLYDSELRLVPLEYPFILLQKNPLLPLLNLLEVLFSQLHSKRFCRDPGSFFRSEAAQYFDHLQKLVASHSIFPLLQGRTPRGKDFDLQTLMAPLADFLGNFEDFFCALQNPNNLGQFTLLLESLGQIEAFKKLRLDSISRETTFVEFSLGVLPFKLEVVDYPNNPKKHRDRPRPRPKKINPPNRILYVFNLSACLALESLKDLFEGFEKVQAFFYLNESRNSALFHFENVQAACHILCAFKNLKFVEK